MTTATGSLFGLAYGDALGKPTEFLSIAEIHRRYGPADLPAALRERCHDQRTTYRGDWLADLWHQPAVDSPATFISRGWDECLDVLDRLDVALGLTVPAWAAWDFPAGATLDARA